MIIVTDLIPWNDSFFLEPLECAMSFSKQIHRDRIEHVMVDTTLIS